MKMLLKGTQMKRIISVLLVISALALCILPTFAQECTHSYLREFVSANCTEKGHTKYTCQKCGDSYKVYDDEYTAPEGFYILAESTREGSALSVRINICNNPGLVAARLKLHYNGDTLSPREVIIGDVWTQEEFTGGIRINNNPLTFFVESNPSQRIHNYENGTFVTVVFDIIDSDGSYGIGFSHAKADFVGWDYDTNSTVVKTPTIINIVGKNELGPHSYTSTVIPPSCTAEGYTLHECSICNDSYTDTPVAMTEHALNLFAVIKEPTLTDEGICEYRCSACGYAEQRAIPVLERWMTGDLNNDKTVNAIDTNLFRRLLVGYAFSMQAVDAADIDKNGEINAKDAYALKLMVSGK